MPNPQCRKKRRPKPPQHARMFTGTRAERQITHRGIGVGPCVNRLPVAHRAKGHVEQRNHQIPKENKGHPEERILQHAQRRTPNCRPPRLPRMTLRQQKRPQRARERSPRHNRSEHVVPRTAKGPRECENRSGDKQQRDGLQHVRDPAPYSSRARHQADHHGADDTTGNQDPASPRAACD